VAIAPGPAVSGPRDATRRGGFARRAIASSGWRFGALSTLGFVLVLLQTARGTNQVGDFWEHAATVRQLMLHTANPGNALLAIHAPSAFFSPYLLVVAVGAKLTGLGPVHALAVAGLINYWLLMAGIWCFTRVFSEHRQAPVYALLFIWLLWGVHPWGYSGFFHLGTLSAVISYPSTFATAIGMLTAWLWQRGLGRDGLERWSMVAVAALGLSVAVLSHPVAGVATGSAMLAIALTTRDRGRSLIAGAVVLAVAALLCLAWPYFSAVRLLDNQGVYDPSNAVMYSSWVERIFPAFVAVVLFFHGTGTLRRIRLGIYCIPLLALFVYGYFSHHYTDGRVIAYIVMGAQIGLADLVANLERPALAQLRGPAIALLAGAVAVFVVVELYNMRDGLRPTLPGTGSEPPVYAAYRAAVGGLPADSTIAAPLNDGAEAAIAVYAGRLIATDRPLAFVKGQARRRQIVNAFFSDQAGNGYRRQIVIRYHVRYIVVSAAPGDRTLIGQLSTFGPVIRSGSMFDTIAVAQ
jgi:hypothetical protein